jgi:hypothetical protein
LPKKQALFMSGTEDIITEGDPGKEEVITF